MNDSAPTAAEEDGDHRPIRSAALASGRAILIRTAFAVGLFVVVALFLSGMSGPADARFPINNFTNVDDTATVTPSGQNVAVSGWVKCTEGQIAEVRVTVTQGQTGAEATGRTRVRCLGQTEVQSWTIHVAPRGPTGFDADSPVRVDAWAVTRSQGERTDGPHTWTNEEMDLVRRGPPGEVLRTDRSQVTDDRA